MDTPDPTIIGGPSDVRATGAESVAEPSPPPQPQNPSQLASAPVGRPKGRPRNLWLVIGVAALVVFVVLVGGGVAENAALSSTYSPERAVTNYFAAQSRGDVSGMMANATFQPGSNPEFINRSAIVAMMAVPQNKDVHNVKVVSSQVIDSSTQLVAVSMTRAGDQRSWSYAVRKDTSQVHDLFYHSWRIVIPFITIHVALPKQPGAIQVDGITPATTDASTVEAVQGYHEVTMSATFLYDAISQIVDGDSTAIFAPDVSSAAVTLAAASINVGFSNCDASKRDYCVNHTYSQPNVCSPAGCIAHAFYWPGYGQVLFTSYRLSLVGDPTTGMKLFVPTDAGQLQAYGTCYVTMTINGNQNYSLAGPWAAVLTWENGRFTADVTYGCQKAKA